MTESNQKKKTFARTFDTVGIIVDSLFSGVGSKTFVTHFALQREKARHYCTFRNAFCNLECIEARVRVFCVALFVFSAAGREKRVGKGSDEKTKKQWKIRVLFGIPGAASRDGATSGRVPLHNHLTHGTFRHANLITSGSPARRLTRAINSAPRIISFTRPFISLRLPRGATKARARARSCKCGCKQINSAFRGMSEPGGRERGRRRGGKYGIVRD